MNRTLQFIKSLFAITFVAALALPCFAQTADATDSRMDTCSKQQESVSTRTFYLTNSLQGSDSVEIVTALRNMLCPSVKIFMVANQNAIVVQAGPSQLSLAEKLLTELDRPKKTYRLTYTITDVDDGKAIGTQHYAMVVAAGQRTTMKEGDKVPVATGSYSSGSSTSQTQFTYIDVGINLDATLDELANGVRLRSKVERSGVGASNTIAGVQEPIIRQSVLEGTAFLIVGKPVMLGSIDIPNSTHHLDIAVLMDQVK